MYEKIWSLFRIRKCWHRSRAGSVKTFWIRVSTKRFCFGSVADLGCLSLIRIFPSRIPDLGSQRFRIHPKSAAKNLCIFNTGNGFQNLLEIWSEMFIPDPDFFPSWIRIPNPGVKKALDAVSGSATLALGITTQRSGAWWRRWAVRFASWAAQRSPSASPPPEKVISLRHGTVVYGIMTHAGIIVSLNLKEEKNHLGCYF